MSDGVARDIDLFFTGNRDAKHHLDKIDRIVQWSKLAPASALARVRDSVDDVSEPGHVLIAVTNRSLTSLT